MKKCSFCNQVKDFSEFNGNIRKNGERILRSDCKTCCAIRRKISYEKRKEIILERNKKYIEARKEYKKKYDKERSLRLKKPLSELSLKRYHKRKQKDINFRITRAYRARVYFAVKNGKKCAKTKDLIGCSIDFLKNHLQSMFKAGMTFDNYGEWHIDHIIPCSAFNLSIKAHQYLCFNWRNLQPLWAAENVLKSDKLK